MSIYRLEKLFSPASVAVVGASARPGSLGAAVMANLVGGKFRGRIDPVNRKGGMIAGLPAVRTLGELTHVPDLVVICTPADAVLPVVEEAAMLGVGAAVILTAGLGHGDGSLAEKVRLAARRHGLRIVGPNCLGVLAPGVALNASFAAGAARPGDLALVSQSGAIVAAMLAFAQARDIGFSGCVSLGDQIDVDFGDLIDWFAEDARTKAILLYIEQVADARKFMSAARAAARVKPVLAVKAGRRAEGSRAALSHTGALAGSDAVYDAAFRRAGIVRVEDMAELFAAAETLSHLATLGGERVAILTNGGGLGVLAADRLADETARFSTLSAATMTRLDAVLPPTWSRGNPVDIIGDADAARYDTALEALLADDEVDIVLALNCPTALASSADAARSVARRVAAHRRAVHPPKAVFGVWLGDRAEADATLGAVGIPTFDTETEAVRGMMHLVAWRRSQARLMRAPPGLPPGEQSGRERATTILEEALSAGREWLTPEEACDLLGCYGLPVLPVVRAADPDAAVAAARPFLERGESCALKIVSPDIVHKSDVGGVRLGLADGAAIERAARGMIDAVRRLQPRARLEGFLVQPMMRKSHAREVIAGIADDPVFGPVILFGAGGVAVDVLDDKALALPPLDLNLAHDLIRQTRVSRLLAPYRDVPAANTDALAAVLVALGQIAADQPAVRELDLNPLLVNEDGAIALDARVAIRRPDTSRGAGSRTRLSIRPYPAQWERTITTHAGLVADVRPVRPEDVPLFEAFARKVSAEDLRLRFFVTQRSFSPAMIARLVLIDYARAMAFVAVEPATGAMIGIVHLHADANLENAEYAILVRSDMQGRGLGRALMTLIIDYAKAENLRVIVGHVLRENLGMLGMCDALGFTVDSETDDPDVMKVRLDLAKAAGP